MGRDYHRFNHRGCTFLVLNTQLWKSPLAGETEKQQVWLEHALAEARQKTHPVFVVQHYPPFEKTADDFDNRLFGFRLWHVDRDGSYRHEFVPLRNQDSGRPH